MNTLEDRVRAATRAAADTVPPDGVPPLRLPRADPAGNGRSRSWFSSPWARRLAPLAAALAVVAVVVTTVIVGQTAREPAPASKPTSVPVVLGPGGVPPYYVALAANGNPNFVPSYAVVRDTTTGATLGTIEPPGHDGTFVAVTAADDDKTFVLSEEPFVSANSNVNRNFQPHTFYLLSLGPSGSVAALSRLRYVSTPQGSLVTGLALSPDGTRLAVAVEPDNVKNNPNLQELRLYTLATGALRTWSATGTIGNGSDSAAALSWTADRRILAFDWIGNGKHPADALCDCETRLLDVTAAGSDLVSDSRSAAFTSTRELVCQSQAIITPDGSTIVCGASNSPGGAEKLEFLEYSAATGRIIGSAYSRQYRPSNGQSPATPWLMWASPSGSTLIGSIQSSGKTVVGIIRGGRLTPLPWSSRLSLQSVAW